MPTNAKQYPQVDASRSSGAWYASLLEHFQERRADGDPVYHDAESAYADVMRRDPAPQLVDRDSFMVGWWYARVKRQVDRIADMAMGLSIEQSEQLEQELKAIADQWGAASRKVTP